MNDDVNILHKYYSPFLSPNKYEDVSTGTEYDTEKRRVSCH